MMYITAMGAVLVFSGSAINGDGFNEIDSVIKAAFNAQFAGSFLATLFWVCIHIFVIAFMP